MSWALLSTYPATADSSRHLPARSAPRRAAQLLSARPDLKIEPLRGNIDTRLGRLTEGDYDAIVLAAALVWVTRELLTSERARRADTERLLTIQVAREQTVVAALDAINELPDLVRSIREELGRREERRPR